MSAYDDIVGQIEARNSARQEEWRAKALARRSRKQQQQQRRHDDGETDEENDAAP